MVYSCVEDSIMSLLEVFIVPLSTRPGSIRSGDYTRLGKLLTRTPVQRCTIFILVVLHDIHSYSFVPYSDLTDLHRSGSSPHSAGRRQGGVDERYSAAVDRDGTWLGSHRSVA